MKNFLKNAFRYFFVVLAKEIGFENTVLILLAIFIALIFLVFALALAWRAAQAAWQSKTAWHSQQKLKPMVSYVRDEGLVGLLRAGNNKLLMPFLYGRKGKP
jgi:hypothetical protein